MLTAAQVNDDCTWTLLGAINSIDPSDQRRTPVACTKTPILSMIETCRLRKIDPWSYIAMVLTQARRGIKHLLFLLLLNSFLLGESEQLHVYHAQILVL